MFHFTLPKGYEPSERSAQLTVSPDPEFKITEFRNWLIQTEGKLAGDMYPLAGYDVFCWDGPTPTSYEMCKQLVLAGLSVSPDYVWIDGKVQVFKENIVWEQA